MKDPKIQTLFSRDEKFKVDTSRFRIPEFGLIKRWLITEKIDGTNIRVFLEPEGKVRFGGRTDRAQIPVTLLDVLRGMFTVEKMVDVFNDENDESGEYPPVILYGEGYGPKIQKGGKYRSDHPSFRLFDVRVGDWWLNWDDVEDIAHNLDIETVPVLYRDYSSLPTCYAELEDIIPFSIIASFENERNDVQAEGIVARTNPLLCRRNGERLMWKLKFKDFG
jgi:ATP-dependent RNA circularization protein (DNA/RNA ligase family)